MGSVTIYVSESTEVLSVTNSCFKAEKGQYRIVGFDSANIREVEEYTFIPTFFSADFSEKEKAVEELLNKRDTADKESIMYFLFDDKGDMVKVTDQIRF